MKKQFASSFYDVHKTEVELKDNEIFIRQWAGENSFWGQAMIFTVIDAERLIELLQWSIGEYRNKKTATIWDRIKIRLRG